MVLGFVNPVTFNKSNIEKKTSKNAAINKFILNQILKQKNNGMTVFT